MSDLRNLPLDEEAYLALIEALGQDEDAAQDALDAVVPFMAKAWDSGYLDGVVDERDDPGGKSRWPNPVSESPTGCWLWQGEQLKGYGRWSAGLAHRHAYQELRADIPAGLELDHLCRTPLCVNPWHLEPVPKIVNIRRHWATQTHCKRGHEFTPENTYGAQGGKYRSCRKCTALAQRRYQERKRAS